MEIGNDGVAMGEGGAQGQRGHVNDNSEEMVIVLIVIIMAASSNGYIWAWKLDFGPYRDLYGIFSTDSGCHVRWLES